MVAAPLGPGSSPDPPPPSMRGSRRGSWACCVLMASLRTVPLMCARIARMALALRRGGRGLGPGAWSIGNMRHALVGRWDWHR